MPIQDYSSDPDLNVQISGINIAEGCPPSGINNAIRQLMADVKVESEAKAEAITAAATQASLALEAFAEGQAAKDAEQALADAAQDAAIAEAKSSAEAAGQAAANAQSSADAALAKEAVLPGSVIAWAANSTPNGYLLCNGAAVSRTTYAALFAAIGTLYGTGDGSTTFNLPNLTDRFIQGSGTAGTVKNAGLPQLWGQINASFIGTNAVPQHSGALYCTHTSSNWVGTREVFGYVITEMQFQASLYNPIFNNSDTVQPPTITMRYYIKY